MLITPTLLGIMTGFLLHLILTVLPATASMFWGKLLILVIFEGSVALLGYLWVRTQGGLVGLGALLLCNYVVSFCLGSLVGFGLPFLQWVIANVQVIVR
jgi:hypothetical protein